MRVLLMFLVLLASFHSGSYAHAFTSLSPVAGNLVRVNHLIRFDESMSNPKNKPSREPTCEPTNDPMVNDQTTNQRLEWDAELPNILSPKQGKYSLSQKQDDHDKIKVDNRVTFENNRDDEIQCGSREQSKTHLSDWHGSKQQSFILLPLFPS